MVNPILRELQTASDVADAAKRAEEWGYPRRIAQVEIIEGVWILDERGAGVMWFTWLDRPNGIICVHGIGSPEGRKSGQLITPWLVTAIEVLGGIFGATRIYSALPTIPQFGELTKDFPVKAMRRYLRSLGFHGEDEIGPYIDLKVEG